MFLKISIHLIVALIWFLPGFALAQDIIVPTPLNVKAEDNKRGREIKITWQRPQVGLPFEYNIYRSQTEGTLGSRIARGFVGEKYIDTKVNDNETYYYSVVAVDTISREESDPSSQVSAFSTDELPPDPPSNVRARAKDDGEITVSWNSVRNDKISSYAIYRHTSSASIGTQRARVNKTSYTEFGLNGGVTYYYSIKAIDIAGNESQPSEPVSIVAVNDDQSNLEVSGLAAEGTGRDGQIKISWQNPSLSNFAHNTIYRSLQSGDRGTPIAGGVRGRSFTDKNLENGRQYYYTVLSVSKGGVEHENRNQVHAAPFINKEAAPFEVRELLVVDRGDGVSLRLSWQNPLPTSYKTLNIYRSEQQGELGELIISGIRTGNYLDNKGILPDTRYYYTVKAVNDKGVESKNNIQVAGLATVAISSEGEDSDSDGDGLSDGWERRHGYHPRVPDLPTQDDDSDGLGLLDEYRNNSDPWDPDTDGDGFDDGTEVNNGYDPLGSGKKAPNKKAESNTIAGNFSYNKSRIPDLNQERELALELKNSLEKIFGTNQIPVSARNWYILVNSYIYGGYTISEIVHTLRFGPGLVHPSLPANAWRQSGEYKKNNI